MVVVATVGIAAGTFGPLYLHGADQSVLQATLRSAPAGDTGLTLLADDGRVTAGQLYRAAGLAPGAPNGQALYGNPIVTVDRPVSTVSTRDGQAYGADLISHTGICRHLSFAAGSCPRGGDEVALSTRSAAALGLAATDHVTLALPHTNTTVDLRISGLFRPPDVHAAYWWGANYFGFGFGSPSRPELDDFVTTQAQALSIAAPGRAPLLGQLPLLGARVSTDDVAAIEQSSARFHARAADQLRIQSSSSLPQFLQAAATDEHTMATVVTVVLVQLVLLALIILYFVAARSAESREPDVRLAELRGFPLSSRAAVALLEPSALLAVALPLGILLAWGADAIAAPHLFGAGASSSLDPLAIGIALATTAAGVVATVLGARGLLLGSRSGATGPRSGTGPRPLGIAVDAMAIVVAGVAFAEVAVSGVSADGRTDPLAALAPGLLALGLGVAGARLLPLMAGATLPMTRNSPRVGTALATRRVARLPHLSRQVVVLSVAVGLALFAVSGWAVAGHNRIVVSEFEVGAAKVLTVQVRPGVQFEPAVRHADPTGHSAMAVVVEHGSDGETLAVDSQRFAAVASWPAGLTPKSATAIAAAIGDTSLPAVMLGDRAIRVAIDMSRNVVPAPQLQATVFDDAYDTQSTVGLGSLLPGSHDDQASIVGDCAESCRLVSLGVTWSPPVNSSAQTVVVPFRITSLAAQGASGGWTPLRAGLTQPHHWQSLSTGVVLASSRRGLTVRAVVEVTGGATTFGPADVPSSLPAVVIGSGPGVDLGVGLDGATITLEPVASAVALPGVGPGASLVDLTLAERSQSGPMIDTTKQVWLAAGASPAIVPRLEAQGIVPLSAVTAVERDQTLSQSGISLAYELFVLAAVGGALLAVGSTAFALVAVARRRTDELADLHAVGIGRSVLRRSLAIEQGLVVGFGLALGIAAGLAATAVALPSIPEFGSSIAGPPLDVRPPIGLVGLTVLAVIVVMTVTIWVTTRAMVNRSTMDGTGRGR
jgi:hypothetical protein